MQKVRILIIEDRMITAQTIAVLVEEMGYEVAGLAIDYSEALNYLDKGSIDVALVDINLSDDASDRSGIKLGELLKNKYHVPFIYLTAYADPDTIHTAKKTQPQAYLLKPEEKIQQQEQDTYLFKPIKKSELYANIEIALTHTQEHIYVKDSYYYYKIQQADIRWIEADTNYVKIYTSPQKFYSARITLNEMHQKMDHRLFLQIHRSYIVNIKHIQKYKNDSITIEGVDFKIGRAYQKEVKDMLSNNLFADN